MVEFIRIEGLARLRRDLNELERWPATAEAIVNKHLNIIVERAKILAPVDTGFMRDNIKSLGTEMINDAISGEIRSAAEYSSFVEFGTKLQKAQPHLRPAVELELEALINELANALERIFK